MATRKLGGQTANKIDKRIEKEVKPGAKAYQVIQLAIKGQSAVDIASSTGIPLKEVKNLLAGSLTEFSIQVNEAREQLVGLTFGRLEDLYSIARSKVEVEVPLEDGRIESVIDYKALKACIDIVKLENEVLGNSGKRTGNVNLTQNNVNIEGSIVPTLNSASDLYKAALEGVQKSLGQSYEDWRAEIPSPDMLITDLGRVSQAVPEEFHRIKIGPVINHDVNTPKLEMRIGDLEKKVSSIEADIVEED